MAKKLVKRRQAAVKTPKKSIRKTVSHRKTSYSKGSSWKPWKRLAKRHKQLITAVVAIGLCVTALAMFVPNNPSAASTCSPDVMSTGTKRFGTSISGPATLTTNQVATYKLTLCDPYPKKAQVKNVHFALMTGGGMAITSTSPPYSSSKTLVPGSGTASAKTWNIGTFGKGASKTFTVNLKYASAGSKSIIIYVWDGTSHVDGGRYKNVTVKSPPPTLPLPPTTWDGRNCISYNTGGQNMACPYDGNPFQLKGYSKGGTSTLSYALQCDGPASGKVVVYPQVWFESSQTVSGNFTVYGKKATMTAMAHCMYPKGPALIIFLKPGGSGRSIHIVYTDNADFP